MTGRYAMHGAEGDAQPGSRGRVLANRLGIVRVGAMQAAESDALVALAGALLLEVDERQVFNAATLQDWHRRWLGGIYPWAGQYRQVNMSKGGFLFAAAHLLDRLMADYSRDVLGAWTPCAGMDEGRLVRALALIHAEFILIHPFREGNGRLARLLNTMMALQAGLPALDYGGIAGRGKREYIAAIHAAQGCDYGPMEQVFRKVLRRTQRS
ncbi:MAG: Fic family protein [Luteimonas sp.]|nr:Fic family protein [Luteimonas sp.]